MQNFIFEAIGTHWQIDSPQRIGHELKTKISKRVEKFDKNYSRFRNDSLVTKWSQNAGEYELPSDAKRLFDFYRKLYDLSDGLVTPLIGNAMEQAGYDAEYSLKPKKLTSPLRWNDAIEVHPSKIIVKQPVLLDFGAAGKGYLVDIIAHLLYKNGIDQFCINASGDIYTRHLSQIIGLEDPKNSKRILGTIEIIDGTLCSSASNRRKWKNFHHIINPLTLRSIEKVKATWVKCDNTMLADGIATALFFVSTEILLKTFNFEYAMIEGKDMKLSKNFKVQLFTA